MSRQKLAKIFFWGEWGRNVRFCSLDKGTSLCVTTSFDIIDRENRCLPACDVRENTEIRMRIHLVSEKQDDLIFFPHMH